VAGTSTFDENVRRPLFLKINFNRDRRIIEINKQQTVRDFRKVVVRRFLGKSALDADIAEFTQTDYTFVGQIVGKDK